MAKIYIHEQAEWPQFTWDANSIAGLLSAVRLRQGELLGKMHEYGLSSRWNATLKALTEETIKSRAIEGVALNPESVRSSIARRLGLEAGGIQGTADRDVEGVAPNFAPAALTRNGKIEPRERPGPRYQSCNAQTLRHFL